MRKSLLRLGTRAFPAVVAGLAVGAYIHLYATGMIATPVRSDGFSYYAYLPSWVFFHDTSLEEYSRACCGGAFPAWSGIRRVDSTGRWLNPHPIGVAVLALPLFVAVHEFNLSALVPYRHAAGVAGVLYLAAGLYFLRRLLSRHFTDGVVLGTLAAITFGTNLVHYATYDSLWSHVYSFFLFACLLYLVDIWSERPTAARSLLMGTVVGLTFLVRHSNLLCVLFIPLFGVTSRESAVARGRFLAANAGRLGLAALTACLVAMPQLWTYWQAAGTPFADPYAQLMRDSGLQAWHFGAPHLAGTLVALPKGLLFWSPVLILSVAGLFLLRGRARGYALAAVIFLATTSYLTASWYDWQMGGSFGNRGFTDSLALLAVPMAACYQAASKRRGLAIGLAVFSVLAVGLSLVQMYQYWVGALPYSNITWAQYRSLFLSFRPVR